MGDLIEYTEFENLDQKRDMDIPKGRVVEVHISAWGLEYFVGGQFEKLAKAAAAQLSRTAYNMELIGGEYRKDSDIYVMQFRSQGVAVTGIIAISLAALAALGITWATLKEVRLIVEKSPEVVSQTISSVMAFVIIAFLLWLSGSKRQQ